MGISHTSRPVRFAGRVLVATLLLAAAACLAAPETPDELLHHADQIKLAHNDEFRVLLKQLDAQANLLTVPQRDWLVYLHAWQLGYQGDYPQALSAFGTLLAHTQNRTVRARARISLIYDQINSAHYEDAYANVSALLDSLPQIEDRHTHFLILAVAANLYSDAGQYDLALRYIDQALAYDRSDDSTCLVMGNKAQALSRSGKLRADDAQIRAGLDSCLRIGDLVDANFIRVWLAQTQFDHSDVAGALQLLQAHDAEVLSTHSSALTSLFRSLLARCYLLTGDLVHAHEYAQSAIDYANKQVSSRAVVDAYEVLYEVAKRQRDDAAALAYHEQYAVADKGYRNEESAKALAYQMIAQQVREKKSQIDTLNKQNQVLQLRQTVSTKTAETRDLYLVILLLVLGSIAFWTWRIKRSELKFMKLARRDGLTGIFNHQYFVDASGELLQYCAKSARDACVLVIDLDHFKLVNDAHGHATGDMVLKRAVAACQTHLRSIDIFGRLGGEEFGITLPDCTLEMAMQQAEQLRVAIAGIARADDGPGFPVHASFGVAATDFSGYELRQLMAHADSALYQAKREGRNRVVVFNSAVGVSGGLRDETLDRRSA